MWFWEVSGVWERFFLRGEREGVGFWEGGREVFFFFCCCFLFFLSFLEVKREFFSVGFSFFRGEREGFFCVCFFGGSEEGGGEEGGEVFLERCFFSSFFVLSSFAFFFGERGGGFRGFCFFGVFGVLGVFLCVFWVFFLGVVFLCVCVCFFVCVFFFGRWEFFFGGEEGGVFLLVFFVCVFLGRVGVLFPVRRGQHLLRHSSTVQNVIGLRSAESEYCALTKGGCSGLGLQSLFADWNLKLQLSLHTDSVKGMYPAPDIHEHFTIHKWLRQTAYIFTHNLNNLEHIALRVSFL